jgi:hypothetical protein
MATEIDGTKAPHHGLFYVESASGYNVEPQEPASGEHQSSCFALEEEKEEGWKGAGGMKSDINETRPSLQFCGAKSLASDYRTF